MNTPIPVGMTVNDSRNDYSTKEFYLRMAMPPKARELATLNRNERVSKGRKFQMNLRINRVMKERKAVIAKAKALGATGPDLA